MNKQLIKDALGWGIILWLIGYILGFAFFFILPPALMGWIIMPIGAAITIWVLIIKVKSQDFRYYLILAIFWTAIAIIFDYLFIVKALKPAGGYYNLDVYLYFSLNLLIPHILLQS